MEDINQIAENCKVFIDQYVSCKQKGIDKAEKIGTKFDIKGCMVFYDLTKICVNSHVNFTSK